MEDNVFFFLQNSKFIVYLMFCDYMRVYSIFVSFIITLKLNFIVLYLINMI